MSKFNKKPNPESGVHLARLSNVSPGENPTLSFTIKNEWNQVHLSKRANTRKQFDSLHRAVGYIPDNYADLKGEWFDLEITQSPKNPRFMDVIRIVGFKPSGAGAA